MVPEAVRVERRDGVVVVVMDDGKVNAMSRAFLGLLGARLDEALSAGSPVVVTGNAKVFSAGLDLREVPGLDRAGLGELFGALERVVDGIASAPVPVVAAVGGPAIAGGAVVALACDWRMGAPLAPIGVPELEVGVPFPPTVVDLMLHRLGPSTMRRTVLDASRVAGDEALRLGWLDEVDDDALGAAIATARRLDARSRPAFSALKARLNAPILDPARRTGPGSMERYLDLLTSDATRAGIEAGARTAMRRAQP